MRLAIAALVAVGCARGHVDDPRRVDGDDAIITIAGAADVTLWIDGVHVGELRDYRRGIALEPGRHRLELQRDGYFTEYQELDLAPRERRALSIELAPVLP